MSYRRVIVTCIACQIIAYEDFIYNIKLYWDSITIYIIFAFTMYDSIYIEKEVLSFFVDQTFERNIFQADKVALVL
jgi:hypothetical protein